MKIFLDINNKKVESENKSKPNYYLLKFKDIAVKDEFQEFNFNIVNNIEVKLSMKVKNKFNSVRVENPFQKFQKAQNKKEEIAPKSVIGTGVNMKERMAMFSNTKKDNNVKNPSAKNIPKKLKMPANLIGIETKSKFSNDNKKEVINKENKKESKEQLEKKESQEKKEK